MAEITITIPDGIYQETIETVSDLGGYRATLGGNLPNPISREEYVANYLLNQLVSPVLNKRIGVATTAARQVVLDTATKEDRPVVKVPLLNEVLTPAPVETPPILADPVTITPVIEDN